MRLNLQRRPLNVGAVITPTDDQISTCQEATKLEEDKRKNWRLENIRRKHNYIPFIMNMLKILAEKGQLVYVFLEPSSRTQALARADPRTRPNLQ
jgi:ubiquitin carboxyl-terminal hydrolase L5